MAAENCMDGLAEDLLRNRSIWLNPCEKTSGHTPLHMAIKNDNPMTAARIVFHPLYIRLIQ